MCDAGIARTLGGAVGVRRFLFSFPSLRGFSMRYKLQMQSRLTGEWRTREYSDLRTAVGAYLAQSALERTARNIGDIQTLVWNTGSHTSSAARMSPYGMVRLARAPQ